MASGALDAERMIVRCESARRANSVELSSTQGRDPDHVAFGYCRRGVEQRCKETDSLTEVGNLETDLELTMRPL